MVGGDAQHDALLIFRRYFMRERPPFVRTRRCQTAAGAVGATFGRTPPPTAVFSHQAGLWRTYLIRHRHSPMPRPTVGHLWPPPYPAAM